MPELPEVETARRLIADEALHRRIVDVDDSDTFVCRPHSPGELRAAVSVRPVSAARSSPGECGRHTNVSLSSTSTMRRCSA